MKTNKKLIIIISLIIGILSICISTEVFATEENLLKGTFEWVQPFENEGVEQTYFYSDNYFINTSGKDQNEHLRTMSYVFCLANVPAIDKEDRTENMTNLLEEIGFNQNNQIEYYDVDNYDYDTIGTTIANKKIGDDTVILVVLRGDKYGAEWSSNLVVGEDGDAQGFSEASEIVLDRIKNYQEEYGITKNVKILVTGYSRAGATSNLVGKYINKNLNEFHLASDDNLYVYTFEAPASSTDTTVYKNIHNIVNKNDLIPYVYPTEWDMQNNGVIEEISDGDIYIDTYYLNISSVISGNGSILMPIVNDETGETYKITISDFLNDFFHWLTTSELTDHDFSVEPAIGADTENPFKGLTREKYVNIIQKYAKDLSYIYFKSSGAKQNAIINFFKTDLLGVFNSDISNKMTLVPFVLSNLEESEDTLNMVIEKLGTILDTARENNPNALTDDEYMVIRNLLTDADVLKLLNGIVRSDVAFTGPSTYHFATFISNAKDIINLHYGQNNFALLKKLDSYYTDENLDIKPGKVSVNSTDVGEAETSYEALKALGFTDEDIDANQRGFDISLYVEYSEIDKTAVNEDELDLINNGRDGLTISNFFNITLKKKIGYREEVVEELENGKEVVISIDKKDYKENFSYKIIRLHNGNVDIIDCEVVEITDDKVYFKFVTDKFSIYALSYDEENEKVISPKTGDNIELFISLFVITIIGTGIVIKRNIK